MARCHWLTRIPTRAEHESMNLGQAVAVCLYELIRREDAATQEPASVRSARSDDVDRIGDLLVEALQVSGYLKDLTAESAEQKIRRMVRRLRLTESDAHVSARDAAADALEAAPRIVTSESRMVRRME